MKFYKNQGLNVNDFSTINQERIIYWNFQLNRSWFELKIVDTDHETNSKIAVIVIEGIRKWYFSH